MRKIQYLFIALFICLEIQAQDKFNIRGVLPWHNFLSGPTSWNLSDYRIYLDECRKNGINFIGFHNYTGGGERYATYVEPMIKIEYKNILPQACFDNSMTARWGYLPMAVKDFAFDTGKIFQLPVGAEAFGNNGSITSHSSREHYEKAQSLMRDVLKMAHERGIRMAMGFEFGVIPPEYFSLNVAGDCFYWAGESNMIPNPKSQIAAEIHYAAIDDILNTYPDIDYIWMWLNEHSFMGVDVQKALRDKPFARAYQENQALFKEAADSSARFVGVWALEYMKLTYKHLKSKGSRAKLILRWDELEREDRAKESNTLPDPTDSGASHTVHELIEWVGALQRLGGADKASTLELMKKIAEEKGLPMVDIPVSTENIPAEKRPCIEKLTPSPAKEKDKCKIVRKAYTLTDLLKIHGKKYTAAQFNQLLIEKGFMEILYRNGEPYKAISLKGLKYGVNSIRTDYPDTLLPVWYSDTFQRLVELIEEPDSF